MCIMSNLPIDQPLEEILVHYAELCHFFQADKLQLEML